VVDDNKFSELKSFKHLAFPLPPQGGIQIPLSIARIARQRNTT